MAGVAVVGSLVLARPAACNNSSALKGASLLTTWCRVTSDLSASKDSVSASAGVAVVGSLVLARPAACNNSSALKGASLLTTWRRVTSDLGASKDSVSAMAGVAVVAALVLARPAACNNSSALKGASLLTTWRRVTSEIGASKDSVSASAGVAVVGSLVLARPAACNNSSALKLTGLLCRARQVRACDQSADEVSALSAAARVAGVVTLVVSTPSDRDNSATSKSAGGGLRLRALLAVGAAHLCARKTSVDAVAHVAVVGSLVVAHPSVCNNSSALQSACLLLGLDTQRCVERTIALTQKVVLTVLGTAWTCTATGLTLCTLRHTDRVEREAVAVPFKRTAPLAWCAVVVGPALLS